MFERKKKLYDKMTWNFLCKKGKYLHKKIFSLQTLHRGGNVRNKN